MRVVRVLCGCRNTTSNDMFLFLSFCFLLLCFAFLCFLVREVVNEEGKRAKRAILRSTEREGDNGKNQFSYRLYQMTKENSAINTHTHTIIWSAAAVIYQVALNSSAHQRVSLCASREKLAQEIRLLRQDLEWKSKFSLQEQHPAVIQVGSLKQRFPQICSTW